PQPRISFCCAASGLLHFDVCDLHHLGPLLELGCNIIAELRDGEDHRDGAELGEPFPDRRVCQPCVNLALSRAMISDGVPAGTPTAAHVLASYPASVSAIVGTPGSISKRWMPATASARSAPVRTCGSEVTMTSNATCTCPASRSVIMGALPR